QLDALPRGAAPGNPDRDLRPTPRKQELLQQLGPSNRDGQVDLSREKGIGVVELGQERLEERGRLDLLGLLEEELPPVLQHAPPPASKNPKASPLSPFRDWTSCRSETSSTVRIASRYAAAISKFSSSEARRIFSSRRGSSSWFLPWRKRTTSWTASSYAAFVVRPATHGPRQACRS